MSRCAVCGKNIDEKSAVRFHDPSRNKELYRHESCPQKCYQTKERREEMIAKRTNPGIPGKDEWKVIDYAKEI